VPGIHFGNTNGDIPCNTHFDCPEIMGCALPYIGLCHGKVCACVMDWDAFDDYANGFILEKNKIK
jgi:hypothetical protein